MMPLLQTEAVKEILHSAFQKFTQEVYVELNCRHCRLAFLVMETVKYLSLLMATKRKLSRQHKQQLEDFHF